MDYQHKWDLDEETYLAGEAGGAGEPLSDEQVRLALDVLASGPSTLAALRRELARRSVFADLEQLERSLIVNHDVYPFDDDIWGHLPTLTDGVVLTHRITEEEIRLGVLDMAGDLDLWGLVADESSLEGGHPLTHRYRIGGLPLPGDSGQAVAGPEGWLASYRPGDLLAVRHADDVLSIEVVEEPDAEGTAEEVAAVVREVRAAAELEAEVGDPNFPGVTCTEVVLRVRREDPESFARPLPPLSEIVATTELEMERGYVGLPGTAWYGEPDWLDDDSRDAFRSWRRALSIHRRDQLPERGELQALAGRLVGVVLDLAAVDLTAEPDREPLVEAMAPLVGGSAAAGLLYLRSRAAEGRGAGAAWREHLEAAHALDPALREAANDLAELRAVQGDAREAHRLYGVAGLDATAPEMVALRPFLHVPDTGHGRNKPCPCGSGKKYKLCHGRTALHPLVDRVDWLWSKVNVFAQRGVHREVLLEWAGLLANAPREDRQTVLRALGDPTTHDFAIFHGGILSDFLGFHGPLLPADEREVAESWVGSARRLTEVLAVRSSRGVQVRDLLTGDELEVRDRSVTSQVQVKDILYGRVLDFGDGVLRFRSHPLVLPRMMRGPLLTLLREGAEAEQLAAYLAPQRDLPQMTTSEGEEVVMSSATYELGDPDGAWDRLAAELDQDEEDADRLFAHVEVPGRGDVIRGTVRRADRRVTLETNAVERLRRLQELLVEADPQARLVEESSVPFGRYLEERGGVGDQEAGTGAGRVAPGPLDAEAPDTGTLDAEAIADVMAEFVRQQEDHWLVDHVPALRGRTPREAAADPDLRQDLVALLDDFEWTSRKHPQPFAMDVARLRRELGLDD